MKKTVLFAILDQFADWEYAFLATALQGRILDKTSPYEVKTISVGKAPLKSIGGFTVLPDLAVEEYTEEDFAGLILVGGMSWRTEEAKKLLPLIKKAYDSGKPLGAICDATVFLGINGMLNERKHTSNTLDDLTAAAGGSYTGQKNYQNEQAVRDGNLITANGTAYLEFARECLYALEAYPPDYIENNYQFYKLGFIEITKNAAE